MARVSAISRRPLSPAKQAERDLTRTVRDFMQVRGWRSVRMQRSVTPGAFQSGEPGMADYLFLRYFPRSHARYVRYGACLVLWIEFKSLAGRVSPQQREWQGREALRGSAVWVVDDFDWFETEYDRHFGWLHSGDGAHGQLDLLGELRKEGA